MSPDARQAAPRDSTAAGIGDWPHTTRVMPWLIAGFVAMMFLIPIDGTDLKVHLPFNSKVDRFYLAGMIGFLILQALVQRSEKQRSRRRMTFVMAAALVFAALALASMVPNVDRIYRLGQLTVAEKALFQLLAYIAFFLIIATQVRKTEVPAYGRLVLVLAVITALGTLYESRTGYNVFYDLSSKLLHPIASVSPSPTILHPTVDRPRIVGPTKHGLALVSMLTIALPFAVIRVSERKTLRGRLWCVLAICVLLAASLATQRKTAIVAPVAAFAVLIAYNRRLLRWAPVALVALVPAIHFAAPGALGTFGILANANNSDSTQQRIRDYSGIAPDIFSNPVLGRGYGSLETDNSRWYRILDNEYLGEVFQVGFVGLLAYLAMVVAPLVTARGIVRRARARASPIVAAPPIIAAAAGCAAYAVVSATFDAMSYPQAPYSFFFVAGLIAATAATDRTEPEAAPAGVRKRLVTTRMAYLPHVDVGSALAPSGHVAHVTERLWVQAGGRQRFWRDGGSEATAGPDQARRSQVAVPPDVKEPSQR